MKGILALDIDGTVTDQTHEMPEKTAKYLEGLVRDGWFLAFVTGRSFQWGYEVLKRLHCPYAFAIQNGSLILSMPEKKALARKYLGREVIPVMERICDGELTDFVIYGGYDHRDRCYYRPDRFDPEIRRYIEKRTEQIGEIYTPVGSFEEMELTHFTCFKCFGTRQNLERMAERIEGELKLHCPVISDTVSQGFSVLLATSEGVDKGSAVDDLCKLTGRETVIAAGDDFNDLTMLQSADVAIAMASSPPPVLEIADIIAPPASEQGIVAGIQEALTHV